MSLESASGSSLDAELSKILKSLTYARKNSGSLQEASTRRRMHREVLLDWLSNHFRDDQLFPADSSFVWINDIIATNCTNEDDLEYVADLLIEREYDSPWIIHDNGDTLHRKASSKFDRLGLAGFLPLKSWDVTPGLRHESQLRQWEAHVRIDGNTADVSYISKEVFQSFHINSPLENNDLLGELFERIDLALSNALAVISLLQQNGRCCDRITFLRQGVNQGTSKIAPVLESTYIPLELIIQFADSVKNCQAGSKVGSYLAFATGAGAATVAAISTISVLRPAGLVAGPPAVGAAAALFVGAAAALFTSGTVATVPRIHNLNSLRKPVCDILDLLGVSLSWPFFLAMLPWEVHTIRDEQFIALHMTALATQFLCLVVRSYAQAHTGGLAFTFLDTPISSLSLSGARPMLLGRGGMITATLRRLTCLGGMTRNGVMVFAWEHQLGSLKDSVAAGPSAPDPVAPAPLIPTPLPAAATPARRSPLRPPLFRRIATPPPPPQLFAWDPSPGAPKADDVPLAIPLDRFSSPSRPAPASAPIKVPTAAPSTNPSAYGTPTGLVPATALAHTIGSNVAASFWAATAAPALASGLSGPAAGPIEPVATAPAALVPAVPSDLVTTPRDLVDLWGPSSFVSPNSNLGNLGEDIHAICIGGGIVHPQVSTNERLRQWHWSPGPISKLLQDRDISDAIDRGPGISMDSQICIGARVRINKSCPMSQPEAYEQVQQQSQERLHPIGTSESRWALETVQAGAQIGQYGIPQFLFGWRKLPGVTIKQKYLSGNNPTLVNDLAQPWGLHVSLCTGVIARVRLQQVLATCIDLFMSQRNPIMLEWEILRDKHKMVEVLQNGDLGEWMGKLPGNYANNARDIIEELLTRLLPTGVDAENKLVVSWMHENSTLECLKIPCKGRNLWAQILSDSADLATIACITPSCLESPCHTNHRCQYLTSKETTSFQHRKSFEFLMSVKPFVLNYDDSTADDNVGTSWTLQMNKSYWIGKMDSMLLADVSNFPTGTPILSVRKSTMALSMYKRLRAKRMLRETNAKGAQHCVIISGGPVV
ncbi:uncharacterized protein K441DRAFT_222924 [Cenococcum geophilum 1.58]|uniref:uncharacterized protein n=1 Tax=Cenococcum geophilum 1.58 TaxID=794803 RepID=UPI00358F6EEE|nr:hypothetical protein K441DRAFT_222924 [Cenococcum geophilum 1.58]